MFQRPHSWGVICSGYPAPQLFICKFSLTSDLSRGQNYTLETGPAGIQTSAYHGLGVHQQLCRKQLESAMGKKNKKKNDLLAQHEILAGQLNKLKRWRRAELAISVTVKCDWLLESGLGQWCCQERACASPEPLASAANKINKKNLDFGVGGSF